MTENENMEKRKWPKLHTDLGFEHDNWPTSFDTIESLSKKVDKIGGWPPDAETLKYYHGDRRHCEFFQNYSNNGWWSVVLTKRQYYSYKATEGAEGAVKKRRRFY